MFYSLAMQRGIAAVVICLLASPQVEAQTFELLRFDEDYSYLANEKERPSYPAIKFIPIGKASYWTFGGDIRQELSFFKNEDWGSRNLGENNFLLQRYDLQLDLHITNRFRFFAQARSALEEGRKDGPRFIDQDKLNLQNFFYDFTPWRSNKDSLTIRIGKQEMNYGSGRILSVQDGSNARIDFAGVKCIYRVKSLSADLFAMESDIDHYGVFDNRLSDALNLWGVYTTFHIPEWDHLDLYYIGSRKDSCSYEAGVGHEQRNTFGVRFWRAGARWSYDIESDYQSGKFGLTDISAWALFTDLSIRLSHFPLSPNIGMKSDFTSGNKHRGNESLGTFNALYPRSAYFGYNPLVGAGNLVDLHPYVTLRPVAKMTLSLDVLFNWRVTLTDGIYTPLATYSLGGTPIDKRYIGTSCTVKLEYALNSFLGLVAGFQYFETGPFLERAILHAANAREASVRLTFAF